MNTKQVSAVAGSVVTELTNKGYFVFDEEHTPAKAQQVVERLFNEIIGSAVALTPSKETIFGLEVPTVSIPTTFESLTIEPMLDLKEWEARNDEENIASYIYQKLQQVITFINSASVCRLEDDLVTK